MPSQDDLLQEMARCKEDTGYFRRRYLPVVDRDTKRRVAFRLKPAQLEVLRRSSQARTLYVLKPRRLGVSRAILSKLFSQCHWNADVASISVMQDDDNAVLLFEQVRDWYRQLPPWMRQPPFDLVKDTDQMLRWRHGAVYQIVSEKSSPAGGPTWWNRHYSEFSKYRQPEKVTRLIEGGSAAHGKAIYETTSEGAGAYAHEQWIADNGWDKLFFPWTIDIGYSTPPEEVSAGERRALLTKDIVEYANEHNLTDGQTLWCARKLRDFGYKPENPDAAWLAFHREFPITPELAFKTSRGRVFKPHYPSARPVRGLFRYATAPEPGHVYVMGCDAAGGGEDGDFSAFCVLDVTDKDQPRVVATFYDKLETRDFKLFVQTELEFWGLCLYVGERDEWTKAIQDHLLDAGWLHFYRETFLDKLSGKNADRLGRTSGVKANAEVVQTLQEFINGGKLIDSNDPRIQYEINDFQWTDRNRAEAQKPNHDDMLRAVGLALVGRTQIESIRHAERRKRPDTLEERIAEMARPDYDPDNPPDYEDDWGGPALDRHLIALDQLLSSY